MAELLCQSERSRRGARGKEMGQADEGTRLDIYVSESSLVTRSAAQKLIEGGYVTVNGQIRSKNYRVLPSDVVETEYPPPVPDKALPENIPLDIVYEDNDLIVVNKPKGMVVHPAAGNYSGTLVNALLYHCGEGLSGIGGVIRPGIVHRIDKDTAGLLVVAKNDAAHTALAAQLKEHKAERVYNALVVGNLKDDEGTVNKPLARHPSDRKKMACVAGGREAVTHYKVLCRYKGFTFCEMRLETGRTHQIRVHMASLGHPLAGDTVYGAGASRFEKNNRELFSGQALFAKSLGFVHPVTGKHMFFDLPLPDWFCTILKKLENMS